ncbi:MAG: ROK family protein [Gammaproteobacteria bacterium]|nr:ROK family protein [Gammaproteobacteria bacterium]
MIRSIGIDVGGSTLRVAEVDLRSGQAEEGMQSIPMPAGARPDDVLEVLARAVERYPSELPVGLAFPTVAQHGYARTAANVHDSWIGLDVQREFSRRCHRPVVFLNDADAAGVAEMNFGAGRQLEARRVVVLTFGTGIGSALFLDGALWPNTELGHLMLPGVTDVDGEGYAAASVRTRLALDWPAWTQRVNRYLHELHRLLWPDVFILGGAVSERAEEWMPLLDSPARLLPAALRGHAGVVGAAWAAATDRMAR